ncbi:MAG: hypothetical protein K0R82_2781 [Flavipsychrobacter sp.]|jgi:dTDP-4-amino-4,6-dideoxy-D-galactose acyltransferase|nr:hypothetical protein [Flavipsychrobacter sp.]
MGKLDQVLAARRNELFFYSPYSFIRSFDVTQQLRGCVFDEIHKFGTQAGQKVVSINVDAVCYDFYIAYLPWDTSFFGINTYKLQFVLYISNDFDKLCRAVQKFTNDFFKKGDYCFIEIPSEDFLLIQALNLAGFRTVETRLTYFRGNLERFDHERYAVRIATEKDSDNLMRVASQMRNKFDRFHADVVFDQELADRFLSEYIRQSLKGFADVVLTPAEPGVPPDSFLTAKYLKDTWDRFDVNISKMVLSAVSSETNKGWYKKLIVEMTYHLREQGAQYIFMNTQSTNRAVLHTWQSLGYNLGAVTHILSYTA